MIRVGYFLDCFPNISETFVQNELQEMDRRGVEVVVFSLGKPAGPGIQPGADEWASRTHYLGSLLPHSKGWQHVAANIKATDLWLRALGMRLKMPGVYGWIAKNAAGLAGHVRSFQCTQLHAHFAGPACQWAFVVSRLLGIPLSFTAHGSDIFEWPPEGFSLLIDAANVCVTVTNYNRNYLIDRFGSVAEKFEVITCGVDVGFFKPDSTLPRIPGQILTVGRLAPEKGYGYLLDAAALLHRQGVHYRWLIVGDGPEGHWIEKGIQSRSLEGKVILMGTMPSTEVRRLMASSELFALASIRETAGMVYIEAMATATPVIGTNVLGVSEVVLDSKTGILVAPHDPVALANGIQCLLGSPGLRARLGAQGRKHAVERFSLARQAGKLLSLWEKCGT